MRVYERHFDVPVSDDSRTILQVLTSSINRQLSSEEHPVRLVITENQNQTYLVDVGVVSGISDCQPIADLLAFVPREFERSADFTVVMLVPTGIGCEIGGHAGDAGATARMLGAACDRLIVHPNVVNASDINELPANALYVEGSVLTRLLMGSISLQPVRSNRVLVVLDKAEDTSVTEAAINSVNASRAAFGLDCEEIIELDPPPKLFAQFVGEGRVTGAVDRLDRILNVLNSRRGQYDAVAISGLLEMPDDAYANYIMSDGATVNPMGGAEAMYTHAVSAFLDLAVAHGPMAPSHRGFFDAVYGERPDGQLLGVVEPRLAAEVISLSFFVSVLKGLQSAPKPVNLDCRTCNPGLISANDVNCLVIPDGVLGLPVLAALEQGMHVIAVQENRNCMRNNLDLLPWKDGQFHRVSNYYEAAGLICAVRAGISVRSAKRPLARASFERISGD